jgi:hypothetical protein
VHTIKNKPTKEKESKKKAKEVNIKVKRTFPPYHFWSDFPKHYLHGIRERYCMCFSLSAYQQQRQQRRGIDKKAWNAAAANP